MNLFHVNVARLGFDFYYLIALPAAFLAAAVVGVFMEGLVVRHLYRRPLESLLATWGIGLVLIQIARIRYGDNIGVNAPEWARGSLEVMQDVNLPYARIFIMGLCLLAVLVVLPEPCSPTIMMAVGGVAARLSSAEPPPSISVR